MEVDAAGIALAAGATPAEHPPERYFRPFGRDVPQCDVHCRGCEGGDATSRYVVHVPLDPVKEHSTGRSRHETQALSVSFPKRCCDHCNI